MAFWKLLGGLESPEGMKRVGVYSVHRYYPLRLYAHYDTVPSSSNCYDVQAPGFHNDGSTLDSQFCLFMSRVKQTYGLEYLLVHMKRIESGFWQSWGE
jgi:hypothetical protein